MMGHSGRHSLRFHPCKKINLDKKLLYFINGGVMASDPHEKIGFLGLFKKALLLYSEI